MRTYCLSLLLIVLIILAGCKSHTKVSTVSNDSQMANPASVHCIDDGGSLEIRTAQDGSQAGYCIFENGSECEEWAFYRGECP